jgi:hypothetical protein
MTTQTATARAARPGPSAVVILGVLGLLTFALIPVKINTIYSGLPAHPLFLHVPVILIPVAGLGALALAARPSWWPRHGVWVTAVAVVGLGATNLTMGAGEQLRTDLGLDGVGGGGGGGGVGALIASHASAADTLRILVILFTAMLIVTLAVYRADTRIAPLDGILAEARDSAAVTIVLRVAVALLALGSLYYVFHTGDLGAKAVWQNRLHPGGGFGGGGVGSLFGPGG